MALKLVSDFHDYYDHQFSLDGTPFIRNSKGGPNRIEMLNMMSAVGLDVPKHGVVKDLFEDMKKQFKEEKDFKEYAKVVNLVVYTDITAHRGKGKLKLNIVEANDKYPDAYASQYLPTREVETMRCQVIGDEVIWMIFNSNDEWRSNCGDVDIVDIKGADNLYPRMENILLPFYAIDFISPRGRHAIDGLIAIDLNVAPGLSGTPVEDFYSPTEIVQHITKKFQEINW